MPRPCRGAPRNPLCSYEVIAVDAEALRIALDALLENAVSTPSGTDAIELGARTDGDAVIEVADEGCGIPDEALQGSFDRFARADAARTRAKGGVGLGLAMVDAIAKAHGGACAVRTFRQGSVFSLRLPDFMAAPAPARSVEQRV